MRPASSSATATACRSRRATPSSRSARARRRSCPRRASRERSGAEVWLKLEGANPTGSFKDRGMTCAVSDAVREGAEAVICASTGNTAASLAAYAARAGMGGAVIVPEGKIAAGKLAQALMHGARVVALRGNFDEALALVRELARPPSDRARQLGQPVPARGPEDRRVRGCSRSWAPARSTPSASRSATRATSPPTGRASGGRRRAADVRLPGRGRGAARRTARPSSSPRPSPARSASATRRAGRRRWRR